MALIIDGYNLLNAVGIHAPRHGPHNLEGARGALLQFLVATLSEEDRARTTVVFDAGPEAPRGLPRRLVARAMTIHFAAQYDDADTLIEELIRSDSAPRNLTVVSSDHRIQRAARRRKAEAIDSEVWYARVCQKQIEHNHGGVDKPLQANSPAEVDYWIKKFKLKDSEEKIDDSPITNQGAGPFPPGYAEDLLEEEDRPS